MEEDGLSAGEVSRPVVKARGEVEERIMARVVGELERWVKMAESSCHMLGVGAVSLSGGEGRVRRRRTVQEKRSFSLVGSSRRERRRGEDRRV